MRLPPFLQAAVLIITVLVVSPDAMAKHRYFANVHPLANELHRCLGIGWSDGYHAGSPAAWTAPPARPRSCQVRYAAGDVPAVRMMPRQAPWVENATIEPLP